MSISLNNFTCPHCLKENATLFDSVIFKRPVSKNLSIVFCCKSCDKPVVINFDRIITDSFYHLDFSQSNYLMELKGAVYINGSLFKGQYEYFPKPELINIPQYIPENIAKYILESKEQLKRGYYETSIMVCRKSLDLATKELAKPIAGSEKITKLTRRIHLLKDNGLITQDIFDWSIIIRDDGDEAIHSDTDFSEPIAKELINFTELLLMYTFTLPKMVEVKRLKTSQN